MGKPITVAAQILVGLAGFLDADFLKSMVELHRDLCGKGAFLKHVMQGGVLGPFNIHFQNVDSHKSQIPANPGKTTAGSFLKSRPLASASFTAPLKQLDPAVMPGHGQAMIMKFFRQRIFFHPVSAGGGRIKSMYQRPIVPNHGQIEGKIFSKPKGNYYRLVG